MEGKAIPVRVAVRCRPLVCKEKIDGCQSCVQFVPGEQQIVLGTDKRFTYDYVFPPEEAQEAVYTHAVAKLIDKLFKGYNVTVLAYGQTGSGKTFTMGTSCASRGIAEDTGIIPRAVQDIFAAVSECRASKDVEVKVSFLEIYKEDILDLLRSQDPLSIREDNGTIKIPNLTERRVASAEEALHQLEVGSASRSTGSTEMNARSSRSHAIYTLAVELKERGGNDVTASKFHLVDLAGSERANKTKAVGERFREGVQINRGLLSLGNVISALCDESNHIPYRDSKLTRLLQDSLGGNSHTVMIACVSPADYNCDETLNTLRYADRARKIKNRPVVNRDPNQAEILRLKQRVHELQVELLKYQAESIGDRSGASTSKHDVTSSPDQEATCSLATCAQQRRALLEHSADLAERNQELSRNLMSALDQLTRSSEQMLLDQMENQKLKQLVDQLESKVEQLKSVAGGAERDSVISNIQDTIHEFMEGEKSRREANASLFKVDCDGGEGPLEMSLGQLAPQRVDMNRQLAELGEMLQAKEDLAARMHANGEHLEVVRSQYQATTKELEKEVALLKKERDDLSVLVVSGNNASKKSQQSGISEQRRKRIKELEERVAELRKKVQEQAKMIRLKEEAERAAKKLKAEILEMKQTRVRLMRQLKEESERHRRAQGERDREVRALRLREQQRAVQAARQERQSGLKMTVLRRRMEEALAAKSRLEVALQKRQVAAGKTSTPGDMAARVKATVEQELALAVDSRKLEQHVEALVEGRKDLAAEVHSLRQALQKPGSKDAALRERLEELQAELQVRNTHIGELQQKILDVEADKRAKNLFAGACAAECKLIGTHLFQMLSEREIGACQRADEVTREAEDSRAKLEEVQSKLQEVEAKLREAQECKDRDLKAMELKLLAMEKEHQDRMLCLLKHSASTSLGTTPTLDTSLAERLEIQDKEISRLQTVHEELERKTKEVEQLQEVIKQGARPVLGVDYSAKKKKPAKPKKLEPVPMIDDLDDSFEDHSNDENDPDWAGSPMFPQTNRKRKSRDEDLPEMKRSSSSAACKCRGLCGARCGCKRRTRSCSVMCSCKGGCAGASSAPSMDVPIEEESKVLHFSKQLSNLKKMQLH
ncbi:chromosome-associated kinesin KIF4 [Ixodes scapularis]|uniref:chromosome-associated kinesin KIF4 n=1 Tax=Ixodes scapularis TaxID=6945 RepID=UPI001A9F1345|nr:chromosome-associated kinesin KIF4 [Ixodes scapularis]